MSTLLSLSRISFVAQHLSLAILLCLSWTTGASAETIAFFPLLDRTADPNGINTPVTTRLHQELLTRGHELIPQDKIMSFLVAQRIRTLGSLSSYQGALVRKDLGAELILQGSICQLSPGERPILGLSLQLSRSGDGHILWSNTETLSYSDQTSLLGLNDPQQLEDLYPPFFEALFSNFGQYGAASPTALAPLNIASVLIQPQYLGPDEDVSCRIKMHPSLLQKEPGPELSLKVGKRIYPLTLDATGEFLEGSWDVGPKPGAYPIRLVAQWPSGAQQEGIIGTYNVDTRAPGAILTLIGKEEDGEIFFSDKLLIIPKLIDPEPIVRWEISVTDEEDETIVLMGAQSRLPRQLTWRGKTTLGNMASPGRYQIHFTVWDRAEHESSANEMVQFRPQPPEISIEVSQEEGGYQVALNNSSSTPISFWWAKFYEENGRVLKMAQGTEFPVAIDLAMADDGPAKIHCTLAARDILGNQYREDISNLMGLAAGDEEDAETSIETEWVEEF